MFLNFSMISLIVRFHLTCTDLYCYPNLVAVIEKTKKIIAFACTIFS